MVERDHFGADRAIDEAADFLRHFHEVAARLGDQRGIGGDAIEQAGGGQIGMSAISAVSAKNFIAQEVLAAVGPPLRIATALSTPMVRTASATMGAARARRPRRRC
jgi:hypothetical protein